MTTRIRMILCHLTQMELRQEVPLKLSSSHEIRNYPTISQSLEYIPLDVTLTIGRTFRFRDTSCRSPIVPEFNFTRSRNPTYPEHQTGGRSSAYERPRYSLRRKCLRFNPLHLPCANKSTFLAYFLHNRIPRRHTIQIWYPRN